MNDKKNRSYSLGKIITLVLILLIPGLLHLYLRNTGENIYKPLPFLGKEEGITTVLPFQLVNEKNELVKFPEAPMISVVNFVHSDCETFGDLMLSGMGKIATKFAKHPLVDFYSISLDSNDTPDIMKGMANRYNTSNANWHFLTGPQSETSRIAMEEFLVDGFQDSLSNNKIIHSPFFVLLDSKQQIRGYYEFFSNDEMDRLTGEIILLITEENRKHKADFKNE